MGALRSLECRSEPFGRLDQRLTGGADERKVAEAAAPAYERRFILPIYAEQRRVLEWTCEHHQNPQENFKISPFGSTHEN